MRRSTGHFLQQDFSRSTTFSYSPPCKATSVMPSKLSARERAWGTRYDTLESLPPSPPHSASAFRSNPTRKIFPKPDDAPASPQAASAIQDTNLRDSSIFVGSLSANMEHTELTTRLSEHLSSHSRVQAVKVVRDSRGGVCAFIQCESPAAASELLHELQVHPPRPFCGRFLRFEVAKAFRTLLVSYRIPKQFMLTKPRRDESDSRGESVENLGLPHALRIFRPHGTKHWCLAYDSEALDLSRDVSIGRAPDATGDVYDDLGVLINPLQYDEDNLRLLVSVFGPVESFEEQTPASDSGSLTVSHATPTLSTFSSYPHNAPRSLGMSKSVWAVKWKDREDSVLALQTLRRIPHLTVSWAHHRQMPEISSPVSTLGQPSSMSLLSPPMHQRESCNPSSRRPGNHQCLSPRIYSSPLLLPAVSRTTLHSDTRRNTHSPPGANTLSPRSGAMPHLSPVAGPFERPEGSSNRWADQVAELDVYEATGSVSTPPRTSSPLNGGPTPPVEGAGDISVTDNDGSVPTLLGPMTPRRDYKLHSAPVPRHFRTSAPNGSIARSTPWSHEPSESPRPAHRQHAREVDPRTIFVGGLEVEPVDGETESRLRCIFSRFGDIEGIQVIKPFNKPNCFAFVKFKNAESASCAMLEEHNKIHHGRSLRVQLRDRNPYLRGGWKPGRSRGRPHLGDLPPSLQDEENLVAGGFPSLSERPAIARNVTASLLAPSADGIVSPSTDVREGSSLENLGSGAPQRLSLHDIPSSPSSTSSDATKVPSVQHEMSAAVSSAGMPSIPIPPRSAVPPPLHPMTMGYVLPQQWIHAYPSPYPYPMQVVPGYPYPGFVYPHMPPTPPALIPSDSRGIRLNVNASDNTSEVPVDRGSSKTVGNVEPAHPTLPQNGTQPPLQATGFIQNDQGTLIPVYQRDALDQYMANVRGGQANSTAMSLPSGTPTAVTATATWPNPPTPAYHTSYPIGFTPAPTHPPGFRPPVQPGYWFSGGPTYGPSSFPHPHAASVVSHPPPSAGPAPGQVNRYAPTPSYGPNQPPPFPRAVYPSIPRRFNRNDHVLGSDIGPHNTMHPPRPPFRSGPTTHALRRGP
ncbi:hypothetical protein C8Q79DRAFT_71332 [Trametes meyenii]|nr:hypothetical protein C8Q79DRAFT_71332 [Trametes meyenii]